MGELFGKQTTWSEILARRRAFPEKLKFLPRREEAFEKTIFSGLSIKTYKYMSRDWNLLLLPSEIFLKSRAQSSIMPTLWSVWLLSDYNQIGWTEDKSTDCHQRIIAQDTFISVHIAQKEQIIINAKFSIPPSLNWCQIARLQVNLKVARTVNAFQVDRAPNPTVLHLFV